MLLAFSKVTWNLWRFCSSRTTTLTAFLLTLSSKSISSVQQPSLIEPDSVEFMLHYVPGSSQKIGGPKKTVEIDDSKFGRRNYNRGHKVKGQRAFVGVERESRKYKYSSRCGQNRRHVVGCSSWLDRTRHYSHQWMLVSILRHRNARLHTQNCEPHDRFRWSAYWRS